MPIYRYKAKTKEGKTFSEKIEASDKSFVLAHIKEKGYYPISIEEQGFLQKEITFDFLEGVNLKDIAIFCRQFATIINAGVPVLSCLELLRQQSTNKKLKTILGDMHEKVQEGNTLSSAMKENEEFPVILLNMVEAGEMSGTLDVSLERMAVHFEKENRINNKIRGAMTYPMIVAIIASVVIAVLITFVVPNFVALFAGFGMELPATTKALILLSDTVRNYWFLLLALGGVGVFFFRYYVKSDIGKITLDGLKLRIPIFGVVSQKVIASRFTRTMSTLLASGLPLLTALDVVAKVVDNHVIEKGLNKVAQEVSQGMSLAQTITDIGFFPPMVVQMIAIGEDTGALESILEKTADFYDTEVEAAIEKMTTMLEPLIMVVMAVIVGFIIISIIQPMFGMFGGVVG